MLQCFFPSNLMNWHLQGTMIGKTVNVFQKHAVKEIREVARLLIRCVFFINLSNVACFLRKILRHHCSMLIAASHAFYCESRENIHDSSCGLHLTDMYKHPVVLNFYHMRCLRVFHQISWHISEKQIESY